MITFFATVAAGHVAAMAVVLLLSKYDAVLVDENGRPVQPGAWSERIVTRHDRTVTAGPRR